VSVTALAGCTWKAISNDAWITIAPGTGAGTGSGSFGYFVAENTSSIPRTGTISIGGATFTAMQAGAPCTSSIAPTGKLFGQTGGEASFAVTIPAGCEWTASTTDAWIFITSEGSTTGSGLVTYGVRDNFTGDSRQGTFSAAGRTFTIVQDGVSPGVCVYVLNPASAAFNSSGGNGSIQVSTGERCAWEAMTNVNWITVTSEVVGIGAGSVTFTVAPNPGAGGRAGVIMIGGQSFRVKQKGH
jgi:hypothetical protein